MREDGPGELEGVVHERLPEGVWEVLLGAEDVGDAHGGIVHCDAKVVHGHAVGSEEDEVAEGVGVPANLAADHVVNLDAFALGHPEPVGVRGALGHLRLHILLRGGGPLAHVLGRELLRLLLLLHCGELLIGAEARVRVALIHELLRELLVDGAALGLAVGAVRSGVVRTLVPVEAEPLEVPDHGVLGLAGGPRGVGVLDAEDELAAHPARVEPVEEGGAGPADVEVAGGGRREAHAHGTVVGGHLDLDLRLGGDAARDGRGDGSTVASGPSGHRPAGGATHLGAAYVRAAEGDGRVGTHHERRHRVVRVLVTDGEVSLARVSRVWGLPWILAILSSS